MSKRWAIQVTYANGEQAMLRHGSRIGAGPVATFGSRMTADINAEMVQNGLGTGDQVAVVQWRKVTAPTVEKS